MSSLISFVWASSNYQEWEGSEKCKIKVYVSCRIRTHALEPELASRRAEHNLLWRLSIYIFVILFLTTNVCVMIFMAALVSCWSSVFIRELFTQFKCVLLITQLLRLVGRLTSRKPVKLHKLVCCRHSVRNRCPIEVLVFFLRIVTLHFGVVCD